MTFSGLKSQYSHRYLLISLFIVVFAGVGISYLLSGHADAPILTTVNGLPVVSNAQSALSSDNNGQLVCFQAKSNVAAPNISAPGEDSFSSSYLSSVNKCPSGYVYGLKGVKRDHAKYKLSTAKKIADAGGSQNPPYFYDGSGQDCVTACYNHAGLKFIVPNLVQGATVNSSVWQPNVSAGDYHSLDELLLASSYTSSGFPLDTIELGWTVDRTGLNGGDYDHPHIFSYYTNDSYATGSGCYNVGCGFVPYANAQGITVGSPLPGNGANVTFKVLHSGGNWWLYINGIPLGYYPDSLFGGNLANGAINLQAYGETSTVAAGGGCTQMGNNTSYVSPYSASMSELRAYISNQWVNPQASQLEYYGINPFNLRFNGQGASGFNYGGQNNCYSYNTAFQANTGHLWSIQGTSGGDQGLGMWAGTRPSYASISGEPVMAFEANTGVLWYRNLTEPGGTDTGQAMAQGTDPSITALVGGGFETAYQGPNGHLWVTGTQGTADTGLGMWPGTSPSIAALSDGHYIVAFNAAGSGSLYTYSPGNGGVGTKYWGLGVWPGTSPSITGMQNNTYEITFHAAGSGDLWVAGSYGSYNTGNLVNGSPSIAAINGFSSEYEVAYVSGSNLDLCDYGTLASGDLHLGMYSSPYPDAGPAIVGLSGGGYEIAFEANTNLLWTTGSDGTVNWGTGMYPGSSPAIIP